MSNWQASSTARTIQHAEAQLRRADSFRRSLEVTRARITRLRLCELGRRFHLFLELGNPNGPNSIVLRVLERGADWAHDRRLFEVDRMAEITRRARDAEIQAEVLYQESEGR